MSTSSDALDRTKIYTREDLSVLNLLEHPIYVFDIQNKCMWWANRSAVQMWNAESLEALLERDFSDMSEASERRMVDYVRRFQRDATERIREQWTMYPNGEKMTVNESNSGITIGPDGHMAILSECELGSLQKSVDQAALRSVELLRHLPVAVSQFDGEGHLMEQNPEALDLFGGLEKNNHHHHKGKDHNSPVATTPLGTTWKGGGGDQQDDNDDQQAVSSFTRRFVDPALGQRVLQQVQTTKRDAQVEAQQYTTHGARWFAVQVRRSRDPVTEEPVLFYSARDISQVVEAKNAANQAAMEKSEMLAVLSHEIRTPLHQVVGFVELLSQTVLTGEQADFLQSLQSSTVSLMSIINDVLDYTKLEAGKMQLEEIPFDPKSVCEGCAEVVGPIAPKKGLELTTHTPPPSPATPERVVHGDPNRIRQVLLNLLSNAVKFTHKGRISLQMSLHRNNDQEHQEKKTHILKFVVTDTGVGMSPEQLPRIFEKYNQADAAVARRYGGTGLGLAICQALAQAMGGRLNVKSRLGAGSEFSFQVPVRFDDDDDDKNDHVLPEVEMKDASDRVPAAPQPSNLRILVAEDNKMNRKLVAAMLNRGGYHDFCIVENGQLAVEEIESRRSRYDLVLMDVQMPLLDGVEATKRIRRNGWCKATLPVVGLTASFQKADLEFYQDIGMNDCIGKPVRLDVLKGIIESLTVSGESR